MCTITIREAEGTNARKMLALVVVHLMEEFVCAERCGSGSMIGGIERRRQRYGYEK